MATQISSWQELLTILGEMEMQQNNPSDMAGYGSNPVEDIEEQLKSANTNWNKISEDLDQLQGEMNQMIQIATAGKLFPASDPNFIKDLLEPTAALIGTLKSEMGTPNFASNFKLFLDDLGYIKQDILQG